MVFCFDSQIAKEYGLVEAIILQYMARALRSKEALQSTGFEELHINFNFLPKEILCKAVHHLMQLGLISNSEGPYYFTLTTEGLALFY